MGGVELKGCTCNSFELNPEKIEPENSDGWLNIAEQPRVKITYDTSALDWAMRQAIKSYRYLAFAIRIKTWTSRGNRPPRGMRRYK